MKMADAQKKAKSLGIKPLKMRKTELVRTIQAAEGNLTCYQTPGAENCGQAECCWRDDCF
jgi:hypothetical protein